MKSRDLSWVIYIGMVIEIIGGLGVIGTQLNFMALPTSIFIYIEEIFCAHYQYTWVKVIP